MSAFSSPIVDQYGRPFEARNLAMAEAPLYTTRTPQPLWTDWTLQKAVADGYRINGWVYRAIGLIIENLSSVPFVVRQMLENRRATGDPPVWEHPVTRLLENPNPQIPRTIFWQLACAWLQLTGRAFLYKLGIGERTQELWPISPSRLAPAPSNDRGKLIEGYYLDRQDRLSTEYTPETVIYLRYPDPANPISGIGPLQAAARAVDTDVEQQAWDKALSQNRGIGDGILTHRTSGSEMPLGADTAATYRERMRERARDREMAHIPQILGHSFDYIRLNLSPVDAQALEGRRWNRDEIAAIFGVPAQMLGSSEVMTRDNYGIALRRFWESKLIPDLRSISETLDLALRSELGERYYIGVDLSGVEALQEDNQAKAQTARQYWDMGVPFEAINTRFGLGYEEFPGWDQPWGGARRNSDTLKPSPVTNEGRARLLPAEKRDSRAEQDLWERLADGPVFKFCEDLLARQQQAVFAALEKSGIDGGGPAVIAALDSLQSDLAQEMNEVYRSVAQEFVTTVQVRSGIEVRALSDDLVSDWIDSGSLAERDLRMMDEYSQSVILQQIEDAATGGRTVAELQQAIIDVGVFDEKRALMIARTLTTTAQSIGQLAGAEAAGATHKTWRTGGLNIRPHHSARHGQTVPLKGTFKAYGGISPRCPGDPIMTAADRINCKCSLSFSTSSTEG